MQIGALRHRVSVLSRHTVKNGYGEEEQAWAIDNEVWAEVRPLGVVERVEAAKMFGNATHLVTLRANGVDVGPEKRIEFKGRTFEVLGQMNWDERDIQRRVMCREAV